MKVAPNALAFALCVLTLSIGASRVMPACAAEATTGSIVGTVTSMTGTPLANATVSAVSASGRYSASSDARGRFALFGIVADTYALTVNVAGYLSFVQSGVRVNTGEEQRLAFQLQTAVRTIGRVRAATNAFSVGTTSDSFTVNGQSALAVSAPVSSSGLATYTAGTVQATIASVPGVMLDQFANAILRGSQVDDAVFDYDSVPIPQGLIAEPGGNVSGAQLPTTGIGSTTVTLAGYQTQGDNSLGGVIDQIPAVGTYPGSRTLEIADGVAGARQQLTSLQLLGATPDRRWRYALASTVGYDGFSYGDGRSFYPAEAATYGVALASRSQYSIAGNVHYGLTSKDDLAIVGLVGEAAYNQYGSPYSGQTAGAFDGAHTVYPGETNPNAPVTFAAGVRGTFDVVKASWLHTGAHSLSRVQVSEARFGASAGGPYWDENGFPNGTFSFLGHQGSRVNSLGYDGEDILSDHHHLRFGGEYRLTNYSLSQSVPTFDQTVNSNPTLHSYLLYFGDTWSVSRRLDLMGTGRLTGTQFIPSTGYTYHVGALDPHVAAVYRLGRIALRATFDHTSVAPKPLEADRVDSTNVDVHGNAAPFTQLNPETANEITYAIEGGGRSAFRATYYAEFEKNRIDVLPFNNRQVVAGESQVSPVGVPTNVGRLQARGFEFWLKSAGFTLDTNYIRAASSSSVQFANNDLNAPAIAANHLFPNGYVPDFTATLSYEIEAGRRHVRISPALSFESGFPYGVGRKAWIFDPATNKPEQVANDNNVNPGANYYFLADPAQPFNAATNPYIGSLGTAEGSDPNTLRSPPQTLVNLHVEGDVTPRLTVIVDVVNIFGDFSPIAYQTNPYLIGPPGYAGGNARYGGYYQGLVNGATPYTLGNGIPTNDGTHQAVPWTYGRAGYVPNSYPAGRSMQLRLRYRL